MSVLSLGFSHASLLQEYLFTSDGSDTSPNNRDIDVFTGNYSIGGILEHLEGSSRSETTALINDTFANGSNVGSISFWYKRTMSSGYTYIGPQTCDIKIVGSNGNYAFSNVGLGNGTPLGDTEHIVITRDSNNLIKLYKNGVFKYSATYYGGCGTTANSFRINGMGGFDNLKLFTHVLSQSEITDLFNEDHQTEYAPPPPPYLDFTGSNEIFLYNQVSDNVPVETSEYFNLNPSNIGVINDSNNLTGTFNYDYTINGIYSPALFDLDEGLNNYDWVQDLSGNLLLLNKDTSETYIFDDLNKGIVIDYNSLDGLLTFTVDFYSGSITPLNSVGTFTNNILLGTIETSQTGVDQTNVLITDKLYYLGNKQYRYIYSGDVNNEIEWIDLKGEKYICLFDTGLYYSSNCSDPEILAGQSNVETEDATSSTACNTYINVYQNEKNSIFIFQDFTYIIELQDCFTVGTGFGYTGVNEIFDCSGETTDFGCMTKIVTDSASNYKKGFENLGNTFAIFGSIFTEIEPKKLIEQNVEAVGTGFISEIQKIPFVSGDYGEQGNRFLQFVKYGFTFIWFIGLIWFLFIKRNN